MNIPATSLRPASAAQPSFTAEASTGAPSFLRPPKDRAPVGGVGAPYMPDIDRNAPAAEKAFFDQASDVAGGGLPGVAHRLMQILNHQIGATAERAQFTFEQKPAIIQAQQPRIVISVGSDDDDSAGQVTIVNGRIEQATGTLMNNPLKQAAAIRHASVAMCLGIAQRNNMPHATAALHEVQKYIAQFDEFGRLIGS